jgi:Flp pilus assembly protein TadG
MMFHRFAAIRTNEQGTALVEFAIAAPTFIFLLFALLDFGRAMYIYDLTGDAVKVGARYAIVRGTTCSSISPHVMPCPAAASDVSSYIQSQYSTISGWTINTTWGPGAGIVCPTGSSSYDAPGCLVKVSITYPYKFLLLGGWTISLNKKSVMTIMQ